MPAAAGWTAKARALGPRVARGVSVDLAQELGRRMGVPVELVTFPAAGRVVEALMNAQMDIGFVAAALTRHGIEGAAVAPPGR